MENLFLFAIFTTIFFVLAKIVEMKYIDKTWKPLRVIIRDAIIIFSCSLLASYGYFYMNGTFSDFLNILTENKVLKTDATQIFTDVPSF
uniref:Uncharacterized protein n=1 Tax=viral metagenome TaxID=1070528 RepID=A0A6C0I0Z2_9ZZZZ